MSRRKLSSFEDRLARLQDARQAATILPEPAPIPAAPPVQRLARAKVPLVPEPDRALEPAPQKPRLPVARIVFAAGIGLVVAGSFMLSRGSLTIPAFSLGQADGAEPAEGAFPAAVLVAATVAPPEIGTLDRPILPGLTLTAAPPVMAADPVPAPIAMDTSPDPAPAAAAPGLFDRLTAMVTGAPAEAPPTPTQPVDFLPPAPVGWVRVTESDLATPGAMDRVQADWALLPEALPLDQNKGFGLMEQFLAAPPPSEDQARVRAQAIYLAGNGEYLSVIIKFRPARAAFGAPGDDMAWRQTLRAEVKRDAGTTETVEAVTLAGIAMFNRTRPEGKSRLSRPIGKDFEVPNGLKLTAALSHRAEVQANGHITPAAAGALIAAFDRKALGALLE